MRTSHTVFDNGFIEWQKEQELPWAKLKYDLARTNLEKHLGVGSLRVLDAGGGNGMDSIPLAGLGHSVDIVDYSQQMLTDAVRRTEEAGLEARVRLHHAEASEAPRLFPAASFDLVLCHNVIGYVEDPAALLRDLVSVVKPGGLISVLGINRYSIPLHTAFLRGDLSGALAQVGTGRMKSNLFDTTVDTFAAAEIIAMLEAAGCALEADYGIRCICDYWGDNDRKLQPTIFEQVRQIEFALTDRSPYKLIARYFQVIARRKTERQQLLQSESLDDQTTDRGPSLRDDLIRAAGGLVWRDLPEGRRLAVIHRQRYDDWTLPKGKLKAGESWLAAAEREVREETGCSVRIGSYAGSLSYDVEGRPKQVRFWHMWAEDPPGQPLDDEADQVAWLTIEEAVARMSYADEKGLLRGE